MKKAKFDLIRSFPIIAVLFCSLFLSGCKKDASEKAESKKISHKDSDISWFEGGIEAALVKAKKESRPLFVYWGAVWCPPCNVVKATVFQDGEFVKATDRFISVYLDGDTDAAQEWGEKLKASSYPTLMILNPEGKEVVRLSSEMSPKEFVEAFNSAYNNLHPIDEIIAKVLKSPSRVSQETWQVVAGYSWSQAKNFEKSIDWVATYKKLERSIPPKYTEEKDRLFLNYLLAKFDGLKKDEKIADKERVQLSKKIERILSNESKFANNYKLMSYYAKSIISKLFPEKSSQRDEFISKYKAAVAKVRSEKPVGSHEHLFGFYPLVDIAGLEGESLSEEELALIKKEMREAVGKIKSSYEQVFLSSGTAYVLREAGLKKEAREILMNDIKNSKTPFYAMASLAYLEKKAGNGQEALKWIEKAYNTSKGNATRLQWGSNYLVYMMELSPSEKDKILRELQKFYRVHLKMPDAFMGRNKKRLSRIATTLKGWQKETLEAQRPLKTLQKEWLAGCEKKSSSKTEYYRADCRKYFTELI